MLLLNVFPFFSSVLRLRFQIPMQYIIMSKCVCRLCSSCPTCFPKRLLAVSTKTLQIFLRTCQYFRQSINFHAETCLNKHREEVAVLHQPVDKLDARSVVSATATQFYPPLPPVKGPTPVVHEVGGYDCKSQVQELK